MGRIGAVRKGPWEIRKCETKHSVFQRLERARIGWNGLQRLAGPGGQGAGLGAGLPLGSPGRPERGVWLGWDFPSSH